MNEIGQVLTNSLLTDFDIYLIKTGKHTRMFEKFGSKIMVLNGVSGCQFTVFAPAAASVRVIGDFNGWQGQGYELNVRWDSSGIWEGFVPGLKAGTLYKYEISSTIDQQVYTKSDPFAHFCECPPKTASIIWDGRYDWKDEDWMEERPTRNSLDKPHSVYEVHLGSWMRNVEEDRPLSYLELSQLLVDYVVDMGFTHVELLPVMEHPYEPSWGYQATGFFAPTSRFGTPQDFKSLVDRFHQRGVGVIMDWVPAHFPADDWALAKFDGSCVYEHPDLKKGFHPDWKSLIFNFERNEIRSFLLSSAMYWMHEFHIDGLRVDAVASMLYLDYSRKEGEWEPNEYGGKEYLAAISFIKDFNTAAYSELQGIQTIAEESTAFPSVSLPVYSGGLGFGMKWMMGWMHDTLNYFKRDPIHRRHHQNDITFSITYAFAENFMLPLSHDEVVHGKSSMIGKMPGDEWQKFANLRTLYAYMYMHPGTKLLFMGNEFAQYNEWNHGTSLDWHLTKFPSHLGIQNLIRDLNHIYTREPACHQYQFDHKGFEWIDFSDHENSILSFLRKSDDPADQIMVICNMTPLTFEKYRIGVPNRGTWEILINTDDEKYWGTGRIKATSFESEAVQSHSRVFSIEAHIPPLGVLVLKNSNY